MAASRTETATFWLVAQCLNQLRHRVPHTHLKRRINQKIRKRNIHSIPLHVICCRL